VNQKGLTLTEILISLLILSIGLLAVLKMQVYSLQAVNNAYYTSQALTRLHSIQIIQQSHVKNFPGLYQQWRTTNAKLLPQSDSVLSAGKVSLSWYDRFMGKRQTITLSASA